MSIFTKRKPVTTSLQADGPKSDPARLIETDHVSKFYPLGASGGVCAVDDVSLTIPRGAFVSVVGASGSGKSTLLQLLGGLDHPTSGTVCIDGMALSELPPDPLTVFRRRYIGFVFQRYNLIPYLNVWENIVLPLGLDGMEAEVDAVLDLLDTLGLAEKRYAMPTQLSGGQQQRVAIARALITKPHILLADEPTGNLDSKTGMSVMLTLLSMHEKYGQTTLVVTHNEELAQMADRRIRLADGRVVSDSEVRK